jgi:hypothetical protein
MLMGKSVIEKHELQYHYTTATGLKGIVESQQLRATNISYLNDAEEHTGFFDRRLTQILEIPIREAVEEIVRPLSDLSERPLRSDLSGTEPHSFRQSTSAKERLPDYPITSKLL